MLGICVIGEGLEFGVAARLQVSDVLVVAMGYIW
jgi:hypothetical protein